MENNEINPYAAPLAALSDIDPAAAGARAGDDAREVFLAWEGYRVLYNIILTGESLLLGVAHWGQIPYWITLIGGAIAANVCFCAGPCLEGYFSLAGAKRRTVRPVLFLLGTLVAVTLAAMVVNSLNAQWGFS